MIPQFYFITWNNKTSINMIACGSQYARFYKQIRSHILLPTACTEAKRTSVDLSVHQVFSPAASTDWVATLYYVSTLPKKLLTTFQPKSLTTYNFRISTESLLQFWPCPMLLVSATVQHCFVSFCQLLRLAAGTNITRYWEYWECL